MNMYLYLIRIEIGVFKNFKECARSPCNGNHFSSYTVIQCSFSDKELIERGSSALPSPRYNNE